MTAAADTATIVRTSETLRFEGALVRTAVVRLWPQPAAVLNGVQRFDLHGLNRIDSAGLALLSLLSEHCGSVAIEGTPPGFTELRAAYRLGDDLGFARD